MKSKNESFPNVLAAACSLVALVLATSCRSGGTAYQGGIGVGAQSGRAASGERTAAMTPAIKSPPGYQVDEYVSGLSYPVDITFGEGGEVFVAEAGGHTYGTSPEKAPPPRIIQIVPGQTPSVVYDKVVSLEDIRRAESSAEMPEGIIPPLTGITWHDKKLYVSHRSRVSVLDPNTGEFRTVVNGLPSWGEFLNAKPIFDANGKMIFFLSTQGNSGVIEAHWIKVMEIFNKMNAHEVPGEDVELAGVNFPAPSEKIEKKKGETFKEATKQLTGVYVPLGTQTERGQIIKGQKICNGAFYRCNPDGSNLERIAWGFRSSFGYRFSPDGRLYTTQNSANPMKPRGIRFDYESVYEVVPGEWYGWPDFYSGIPITDQRFKVLEGKNEFVLTEETHRRLLNGKRTPRQPVARLPVHSAAQGLVFGRVAFGISPDEILVAEMGSIVPLYKNAEWPPSELKDKKIPEEKPEGVRMGWPGFKVVRVNIRTGETQDFIANRSGKPASASNREGLERPVQLEWGRDGSLYIVDFGRIDFTSQGMNAHPNTGKIWRVTQSERTAAIVR